MHLVNIFIFLLIIEMPDDDLLLNPHNFQSFASVDCAHGDGPVVQELELQGDYVGRRLTTNTCVPANIHRPEFREFWFETLFCSDLVKDTIQNGYELPFAELPPDCFEQNNKSARDDSEFVRNEVYRLEKLGCIIRVDEKPRCVLPLSSVFSKKKRVVVDASRHLNPYLRHRKVCFL